jgi:uncharacterized protein
MPAIDFYLDTNVLLAACLAERESLRVRRWLGRAAGALATSDWTLAEFVSALGIKVRRAELNAAQADSAHAVLTTAFLPGLEICTTDADVMRAVPMLLKEYELGLRAGDALHLALCLRLKRTALATADRVLARAARHFGVTVERLY